jgi:D-3-phosphoglycerate dehydrogenase
LKNNTTLVLTEALPPAGMAILRARPDVFLEIPSSPTEAELLHAMPEADGVIMVNERPTLAAAAIDAAPRLRVACRFGAGYDNFDLAALNRRRIPLSTTRGANADAVADHALYLMLALAKRGPLLESSMRAGNWERAPGNIELRDRICVIVGYGHIGKAVARRAEAFGMKIVAVNPGQPQAETLERALPQGDFVVLACPLKSETRYLMNAKTIGQMKPGAFLINVARGPVVDEKALIRALQDSTIAGAGLDVFEVEPLPADSPLRSLDNVALSPHMAGHVVAAQERGAIACARNALAGLDGTLDRSTVVNPEVFAPK